MVGILVSAAFNKNNLISYAAMLKGITDSIGKDNVVFIDTRSSDRLFKLIKCADAERVHLYWRINGTWSSYDELVQRTLGKYKLDSLIVFSNPIVREFRLDDYSMITKFEQHMTDGDVNYATTFDSVRTVICKYKIVKYCVEQGIKLCQFIIDPVEFNYVDYFGTGTNTYILNKNNFKYAPSYEKNIFKRGIYVGKKYDFVFCATIGSKERGYLLDYKDQLLSIKNSFVNIYADKRVDKLVPQDKYYDMICKSKFTLVIPSYDVTTFSVIRFMESVANYCLPLILDTVNLTDLRNTFPDVCEIVEKNLVVSLDGIQEKINQLDYDKLITELYKTQSIKNFFNKDFYKDSWNKYL